MHVTISAVTTAAPGSPKTKAERIKRYQQMISEHEKDLRHCKPGSSEHTQITRELKNLRSDLRNVQAGRAVEKHDDDDDDGNSSPPQKERFRGL